ncbi:MAG TPA: urease accessory protein UreE [Rhizobiaceae bacterium]|nr:urease accessory protein UreE [Rhizobiaceae bacterium]
MLRVVAIERAGERKASTEPFDIAVLIQDERHVRRKAIALSRGAKVLVDFPETIVLADGDALILEDGRHVEVRAAEEELFDIRGRDAVHLAELAWHIGNRHLAAQIEPHRILILRDHVIKAMLEGLGASVKDVHEPFSPLRGAYSGHSHGHGAQHHHHD